MRVSIRAESVPVTLAVRDAAASAAPRTGPFDIERTGSFVVALLVGIGLVSLIVISMYAVVVVVWSARVRGRYSRAVAVPRRRATSLVLAGTKSVVSQPFGPRRVGSDAMR